MMSLVITRLQDQLQLLVPGFLFRAGWTFLTINVCRYIKMRFLEKLCT
jgi:hypothetical protein